MQAIILAAGISSRLGKFTENCPKCLLDINGKNMIGRQLEALRKNGIIDVTIVVGFQHQMISSYVFQNYSDMKITILINNSYLDTNNGYSLLLALEKLKGDSFILMNADTIIHSDAILELIEAKEKNVMAVVKKDQIIPEDMKVEVDLNNKITHVSKDIQDNSYGEFTGICKLSCISELIKELNQISKQDWFEKALDSLLNKIDIKMLDITHYPFIEVDFPEDLETARDLFIWKYPDWEFGIRHQSLLQGKRNRDDAFNLLLDTLTVLKMYDVKHWVNWGTLLGLYRDGDFIIWDTDIDVTCHWKDRDTIINKVEPRLRELGCFIPKEEVCFPEDRWYIRDKEKIELNLVKPVGNMYVYSPERSQLGCPKEFIDTLDFITIKGFQIPIPSHTEEYLKKSYGETWKTPLKGVKPKSL